jgi:hypothetical protein
MIMTRSEDGRPKRNRGTFKITPQEVYDRLTGNEDAVELGWHREFLKTQVDTPLWNRLYPYTP